MNCPAGRYHVLRCVPVIAAAFGLIAAAGALRGADDDAPAGHWERHRVRQGDGKGGWVTRPALRQVLKHPDADYTMPFGLARMDNGEVVILCSREKQPAQGANLIEPITAFSKDEGASWSEFATIPGTKGRPQYLEWLGGGRLSFITEVFEKGSGPQRVVSSDYGRTWQVQGSQPPTKDAAAFNTEGNGWVDRDAGGSAKAILELGYHYAPGKSWPQDDATAVFRRSIDGGKTWIDEVAPPQWKFTVEHQGKQRVRGVSEGSVVRAANGDLVAALRSDILPKYLDRPHDDNLEGTCISISRDDGRTWSDLRFLFDAGRHHANLQRLPNGHLICTLIVRNDIQGGALASHRRGCDALVSMDNGKTWNLDRRFELDRFEFLRKDGYWIDGKCGHLSSLALPDGHLLSVYGNYLLGGAVMVKWKPDAGPAEQVPKVGIQIGPQANDLEKFAANELAGYLDKLFAVSTKPQSSNSPAEVLLLVGSPESNPASARALGAGGWPKVTDQGIVLKRETEAGKPALVIGGGSPTATLWAVYELVERWGVRYLLHGDVLPERPSPFRLPDRDLTLEPNLRVRQWRTVNAFACGPESWGLEEHCRVIDQLAKLRFNRLFVNIWPSQPFLDVKSKGIERKSAYLWFDFHYPVTDDMPGRHLFGKEPEFWNPDLPRGGSYQELAAAGERLIKGIFTHARQRGMQCVMDAVITEFPPEFAPLLPDVERVQQLGAMSVVPGPSTKVEDPAMSDLAGAVLQATVNTYPEVDYVLLGMPEHRQWLGEYERAWKALDQKYHVGEKISLEEILSSAGKRTGYPGGAGRAVREAKGDIVLLYFYDRLLTELKVLQGTRHPEVRLIIDSVAEELFPILPLILPPGSEALNFVDYTPARILKRREALGRISTGSLPTSLIYTLHDDNVGLLPQLATGSLHELTQDLRRYGWSGFSTRYWLIGDHDPCVAYLARAGWDADATPEAVYRDQIITLCGDACVGDMLEVFREVEAATVSLEWNGLGFGFPVPGMLLNQWTPSPLSTELEKVRDRYQRALAAAKRAGEKSSPSGRATIDYWIGRLEFGATYLEMMQTVRRAASAEALGKKAETLEHTSAALKQARSALEAYARVARDQSDRGAIAIMDEYVYRALKAKVSELESKASASGPGVLATNFQSKKVYQSRQHPGYTSWVSFFPGEHGQWYLTCEEVTRPADPLPGTSPEAYYGMGLPRGYDKSKYLMEVVTLQSDDGLETWKQISRQPLRFQHSAGSFAQARTSDGKFLRFVWACYSLDAETRPSEIFYRYADNARTWEKMPPFVSEHFAWYPHRLRTLRDGTLVLCAPRGFKWGKGTEYPVRTSVNLNAVGDTEMTLFFSHDQGETWSSPLPILAGQNVSETDFVELPDGNLLFINNSIFAAPGRQFVYREGKRFTPGPLERVQSGTVPETVCLAEDGLLVGCLRPGTYYWSDDLGQNWHPLGGAPGTMEVYQPWIQYLGGGKVACAGHLGGDDPVGGRDQYVSLQTFQVQALHKTTGTRLWIERDYDPGTRSFLNSFTITLKAEGLPLADKDIQVWHVARAAPGYDSWNKYPLAERMKMGGKSVTVRTDAGGSAKLRLPEYDGIKDPHSSYQLVVRFNPDRKQYPQYLPSQLPQIEYYANHGLDP